MTIEPLPIGYMAYYGEEVSVGMTRMEALSRLLAKLF